MLSKRRKIFRLIQMRERDYDRLLDLLYHHCMWGQGIRDIRSTADLYQYLEKSWSSGRSNACIGDFMLSDLVIFLTASGSHRNWTWSDEELVVYAQRVEEVVTLVPKALKNDCLWRDFIEESDRVLIVPLTLVDQKKEASHSNVLIIDKLNQTIERFEPHGQDTYFPTSSLLDETLQKTLVSYDSRYASYRYLRPLDYCPVIGPQSLQYSNRTQCPSGGYCLVFSTLYTHLRLLDLARPRKEIVEELLALGPEKLLETIQRYLYLLEHILPRQDEECVREWFFEYLNTYERYDPCQMYLLLKTERPETAGSC